MFRGWDTESYPTELLPPRNLLRDKKVAYAAMPVTGEIMKAVVTSENTVDVYGLDGLTVDYTLIVDSDVIVSLDIAYDKNFNLIMCWDDMAGDIWAYWYSQTESEFVHRNLGYSASNPCCCVDDTRDINIATSQVFIFFQQAAYIRYCLLIDEFDTVLDVGTVDIDSILESCGMDTSHKLSVRIFRQDGIILQVADKFIAAGTDIILYP